jgi:hypothetical protein
MLIHLLTNHTNLAFEVALEIHEQAPWVFEKTEVFADGGVRYGSDIVKLLALGVKAVGIGRAFMYANVYGEAGVARAIEIMKKEIAMDAGNLGVADLKQINSSYVSAGANSEVVLTWLIFGVCSLTLSTSTVRGVSRCRLQESR